MERMNEQPNAVIVKRAREATPFYFEERCYITEWLNDSADPAASVVRAVVAPGVTTRWHRLKGIAERYVLLQGQGRVEVGDQVKTVVEPGDVVVIPAGMNQRIRNTGREELIFLAVCTPRFRQEAYEDTEAGGA